MRAAEIKPFYAIRRNGNFLCARLKYNLFTKAARILDSAYLNCIELFLRTRVEYSVLKSGGTTRSTQTTRTNSSHSDRGLIEIKDISNFEGKLTVLEAYRRQFFRRFAIIA